MFHLDHYKHKHYTHVEDEKEADAIAWAFVNKKKMVKFPFKFEPLGEDEVRIQVTYTGLCHSDVSIAREEWGKAKFPLTVGHEIVGIISHLGKKVTNFKVGDTVGFGPLRESCEKCKECTRGDNNICRGLPTEIKQTYGEYWGGYATAIQQPAKFCFHLPKELDIRKVCPLLCAGVTTYCPLVKYCKKGDKVAIIGIGGLGHLGIAYAKALGCEVTAFSQNKDKKDESMLRGASEFVDDSKMSALESYENTFDVILNTIYTNDEKLMDRLVAMTSSGGVFIQVGIPPEGDKLKLEAMPLVTRAVQFVGSMCGSRESTRKMLEFSAKHNIVPTCEFYDWENLPEAWDLLEKDTDRFRLVVNVENWHKTHNILPLLQGQQS